MMRRLMEMWYFQTLCILGAVGYPSAESETNQFDNCIQMTEDIQHQINSLVNKLSSYINTISMEYEDIDLRIIAFTIDRHSSNEGEKDTIINITVNDCLEGFKQSRYGQNDEQNHKESPHSNSCQVTYEENGYKSKEIITENKNTTTIINGHDQEVLEAAKRGDIFAYNKNNDEYDENETRNNNSLENNKKEIYLIDFKEFDKTNVDVDEKINSCNETLLLSDDEKNIFNEIDKVRGNKPFMVYQRVFHNFTQYWFF
ncbi:unnamed protein product [Euphydryas editha]|uniref:Uncharacterized protein n=1 Tax=Euphydryas editha TaxID=104508 RepID=A0AAU9TEK6_EUPED|nr:unnamed protein product [Euphydryas editha]